MRNTEEQRDEEIDERAKAVSATQGGLGNPVSLDTLRDRINMRMNDHLCDMKPYCDDSISGFNDAWEIVRDAFAEAMRPVEDAQPTNAP